ncbi:TetR/AcrR family transcriptional regulator [Pedobacter sp.]|jgi:AcrR family transcriptional regulator|uniref:TetR/AcrR family transcriptional regulator n=1 Tax=Pedobacter sp. TaxID=1411316 RepID=UPI0018EADB35|nr:MULTISPECIES: TetR/AcrR family transcriptional regulator [unclassified Pedobacter]HWW38629.1 TetR/AcrR family transcriptional regulator [Pedobacter sp.]
MAIKDRKERDKLDRRKLIIESATKLFLEQGYEKTSIRNIADDIEYSPATIYLYFKEKDEIFYVIHEQGFELLGQQFTLLNQIQNPFDRLIEMGKTYLKFGVENPDYYDLMFIMRAPLAEIECHANWDAGDNAFQYLVRTVSECLEQQLIKTGDPHIISMSVWSFVHGLVSLRIRDRFKSLNMDDDLSENLLLQSLDYFMRNIKA